MKYKIFTKFIPFMCFLNLPSQIEDVGLFICAMNKKMYFKIKINYITWNQINRYTIFSDFTEINQPSITKLNSQINFRII